MKQTIKITLGSFFIAACILVFLRNISSTKKMYADIQNIFQPVLKKDSISNIVIKKHTFKEFKSTPTVSYVTLSNGINYKLLTKKNINSNKDINRILIEKDSIYKSKDCDTIYLIKKGQNHQQKLYFVLKY